MNLMRIIKWIFSLLLTATLIGLFTCAFAYYQLIDELPDIQVLRNVQYQQPLSVYSRDGLLIEQFGDKKRTPIDIKDTPRQLIYAFTSSEDANFFTHSGVDYKGLARAVIQLLLTGKKRQGGSTITMQVARNFLLTNKKTYTRKIKEIILSFQIEAQFTKEEILQLYLNKIYLGQRAYGIFAASEIYYDRPLSQLTLAEHAMIAGLPKAPSNYNPISNPQRALLRRNYVLKRMLKLGHIQQDAFDTASQAPITAERHMTQRELNAPYIAEMVRHEIMQKYGEQATYNAGLKVYTTLQSDLQNVATKALRLNLHHYDERHSYRTSKEHSIPLKKSKNIGETLVARVTAIEKKTLTAQLKDNSSITLHWKDSAFSTLYDTQRRRRTKIHSFLDILALNDTFRVRYENKQWHLAQIPQAESAFVALNPKNGAILALSGGYAYFNNKYNRAIQSKRQPGSGFKPIIYTTALEQGYTAASLINDAPIVNNNSQTETEWRPENYSHKFYGPTSIRTALRKSRNLISIRLLRAMGIPTVLDTAARFGFNAKQLPKNLSLALGSGYASPLQMSRMYSTFANGGFLITPYFIQRIESAKGEILFQAKPLTACPECSIESISPQQAPRIISPDIHFLMNSLLRDVVRRGTAVKAKSLNRTDLAGKTGTTNQQKDAWFNGFTPDIVGTAWVGLDNSKSLGRNETGGKAALPLWIDFMRYALQDYPEKALTPPKSITQVLIDPETAMLSRTSKPSKSAIWEYFRTTNAPKKYSPEKVPLIYFDGVKQTVEELF